MASTDKPPPTRFSSYLSAWQGWGESSIPPMGLATLITAIHFKPFQKLPMLLFTPMLVFSSYLNMGGFKIDSAALTSAWSGLYVLLAARRRPASLRQRFTARGAAKLGAMGLGTVNALAGGWVYAKGDREAEEVERRERDRWGIVHGLEEQRKK